MRPIALYTFDLLNMTNLCHVSPFLIIFTLWDSQIYICSLNCSNKAFYVKVSIDDLFHIGTVLNIPYVNPNNSHIRFKWDLDNSRLGYKYYIIKDIISFKNTFNFVRWNSYVWIFADEWDIYNLEVQFRLWTSQRGNLVHFSRERIFYAFFNLLKIRWACYIVYYNYDFLIFYTNKISNDIWFYTFESMIYINHIYIQIF